MLDKQYTDSALGDLLVGEVCSVPNVGQQYEFQFHTKFHKKIIKQLGKKLYNYSINAVHSAVISRLTHIKAHTIADHNIDKRYSLKQAVFKLNTRKYLQNLPKNPIQITVSEELFPVRILSDIDSRFVEKIVHTDLNVIGPSIRKVYIDTVRTTEGMFEYSKYNPKKDGVILEKFYNDVQYLLCEEISQNKDLQKITVKCYGDLVGKFQVGDKIRVLGYYETLPDDENEEGMRLYIDSITIRQTEQKKETHLTPAEVIKFKTMAQKDPENYLKALTDSFCPHIYENHLPKLGILLASIISPKTDSRSNILLLLNGSPGVGKSEMLKASLKISDSVAYVDAPNVSARGLLYGQEEFNKVKILRAGVLVRYELVLMDELDKMGKGQREELNTASEQQIASYHKTPFDMDTPINVGIIASANPKGGRWKDDRSIMENLANLESTVIDRYLIIQVKKPQNNEAKYDLMLDSIENVTNTCPMSYDQIRGIINHSKKIKPRFTDTAKKQIKEFLMKFARIEQDGLADLYIETRKEIDLIRIIKKMAQLLLRTEIDEECVSLGIKFYRECMESIGMRTEIPTAQQLLPKHGSHSDMFWEIFRMLLNDSEDGKTVPESLLKEEMENSGKWKTPEKIDEFIRNMKGTKIYEPKVGRLAKI